MRRAIAKLGATTPITADLGLLALRLFFGLSIAIGHGLPKMRHLELFVHGTISGHNLPMPWLLGTLAMLAELAGGLLISVGLLTRFAAAALLANMLVAAFVIEKHAPFLATAAKSFGGREYPLLYAAAAGAVLLAGPGRISLDRLLAGKKHKG